MVLCRGSQHARATDIDFLDDFRVTSAGLNRLLKGVEIDTNQINRTDAVLLHRSQVRRVIAAGQKSAVNLRVQGLHTAIHHFREAGVVRDFGHGQARVRNGAHRATSRKKFCALSVQCTG